MIEPHGGRLVDRVVDGNRAEQLKRDIQDGPYVTLDKGQYQDIINISNGRYSPLEGFMTQNDFLKVVNDKTLEDGTPWTLPVTLDVDPKKASELSLGEWTGIQVSSGELVGVIKPTDIYKYSEKESAKSIFGTTEIEHPGVRRFFSYGPFFVGGKVAMFDRKRYNEVDLLPKETRVLFEQYGWDTIVGFQTRNAPHRAHEYIQKSALEHIDGLLIQPKLGDKKVGDYRDEIILDTYESLIENYYPKNKTALTVFPSKMNYAGPREAVFDAIIRKNQGCTHFIVGRDHAGVKDYYDGYASQTIFETMGDIGITPMFYNYSFYCEQCDGMASEEICPHEGNQVIHPSGTEIRETIEAGKTPSEKMIRPEVASCIMSYDQPFVSDSSMEGK